MATPDTISTVVGLIAGSGLANGLVAAALAPVAVRLARRGPAVPDGPTAGPSASTSASAPLQRWSHVGAAAACGSLLAWRMPVAGTTDALVLISALIFAQAGVLVSVVDTRVRRIPTVVLTIAGGAVVLLLAAASLIGHRPELLLRSIAAAAAVAAVYLLFVIVLNSGIGMGDVRLAALTGLVLGGAGWDAVLLGTALPYLFSLPVALVLVTRAKGSTDLPFGPFIVAGAVAALALSR